MKHLLLLHGAIGAKDQLEKLTIELEKYFKVHAVNFSGHGGENFSNDFGIEAFTNDVLSYLDSNKINSVNIFGYSMGGYVALYMAKHFPERVNCVFTFATKFLWTTEIAQKEIKMLDPSLIEQKIPAFAKILEKRHQPNDWKLLLQKTSSMMLHMGDNNPLTPDDYKTILQPVLIGIGDSDNMVTMEETIAVYKNLPNSQMIVFPNTHHPIEKISINRLKNELLLFMKA